MLDAIKNAIWWCLVLSGAGAGDDGCGLHLMMVKFCDEELCWWISNVSFSKL